MFSLSIGSLAFLGSGMLEKKK